MSNCSPVALRSESPAAWARIALFVSGRCSKSLAAAQLTAVLQRTTAALFSPLLSGVDLFSIGPSLRISGDRRSKLVMA
ncbi:hypothetical protein Nepgr_021994 [Nepenthes gracilis]|uniref:Uncharacterized protein n=1 Tax=Nepenthes gracilis TaxID=150966 RepID=A0AAD3SZG7_NEPGR|nr:hypothetical protein Nepgr_021994 [Nepenthes gracilis]